MSENVLITRSTKIYDHSELGYWWEVPDSNIAVGCDGITIAYREEEGTHQDQLDVADDVAVEIAKAILEYVNQRRSPDRKVSYP